MTDSFKERETAFEAKYARDEELKFKVHARRNKLLGLWAAKQMGVDEATATVYAKTLVENSISSSDNEVIIEVLNELNGTGGELTEKDIARKLEEFTNQAINELSHSG